MNSDKSGKYEQGFIKDRATGKEIPFIRIAPVESKKLSTQNVVRPKPLNPRTKQFLQIIEKPGLKEKDALKLVKDYEAINMLLNKIENEGRISRIEAFFLKRKIHYLVVREYNLWGSMHLIKNANKGTGLFSPSVQREIERLSSKTSTKLNKLRKNNILPRGFNKGIYRFKLPKLPIKKLFQRFRK